MIWNISSRELKKACNNGVCNHCGKRLVTFGADVHTHEYQCGRWRLGTNEGGGIVVKEKAAFQFEKQSTRIVDIFDPTINSCPRDSSLGDFNQCCLGIWE